MIAVLLYNQNEKRQGGETVKKKAIMIAAAASALLIAAGVVHSNIVPELNKSSVVCERLPSQFDGFVIAQVSDLHNTELGKNNGRIIGLLEKSAPDIIVITGDLIDSRRTDIGKALAFVNQAVKIAPCYYVTGNHESRIEAYPELKKGLEEAGVTVLDGRFAEIEKNGATVTLAGIDDPNFKAKSEPQRYAEIADCALGNMNLSEKEFVVLLAHRPELFDVYAKHNVDLVFSGHAHGGQFRLPFIGGLYVPNQGLFPEYDSGIYTSGDTQMMVSRGLGNSIMPIRINNRPEVVAIELKVS